MRNSDLARRIETLEQRVVWLDEHDTRGVQGLRVQLQEQQVDTAANTAKLTSIDAKIDALRQQRGQQYTYLALSLLPIYVLLFLALFHVTPA